jgi:hypothetical protein
VKGLTRIHEWLSEGARANDISEVGLLQIAEEACKAMQDGTLRCWDSNGIPLRKGVPIPEQRRVDPRITDEVGNKWLKSTGHLWSWHHKSDSLNQPPQLNLKANEHWKLSAKERALEILEEALKNNRYPNQIDVPICHKLGWG